TELSPKLVCLGGGGYDLPNVARAWTAAWAVLNGVELPSALPASFAPDTRRYGFVTDTLWDPDEPLPDHRRVRAQEYAQRQVDAIEASSAKQSPAAIERLVKKFGQAQRGVVVYDRFATLRFASPDVAPILPPSLPEVTEAISRNSPTQGFRVLGDRTRFIYATPLMADDQPVGAIAVLQDASHLEHAEWDRWRYNAVRFLVR